MNRQMSKLIWGEAATIAAPQVPAMDVTSM
jgi:hypothetical protein